MERRLKRADAVNHGRGSDAVLKCVDFLRYAFMAMPTNAGAQAANVRGFRSLIERFGVDAGSVPRALAVALSRHFGADDAHFGASVAGYGLDTVPAPTAPPPQHRAAFPMRSKDRGTASRVIEPEVVASQ